MKVFQRLLRRLSDAITHFHIILNQNVCLATLQKNCFWKEASISISLHLWFISNVFAMSISRHQCWRILVPVVCVSHKSFLDNIIFPILILKLNIFEDIQHILSICLSRASYYTIDTFLIFFLKENCFWMRCCAGLNLSFVNTIMLTQFRCSNSTMCCEDCC